MRERFSSLLSIIVLGSIASAQTLKVESVESGSWIAYRLVHPLHIIDAKSSTPDYIVELDTTKHEIKSVVARVDVESFDSGNSNRDSHALEVVEALRYPEATFAGTEIVHKGDSLFVTGKLSFHGVTKDIMMAGTGKWRSNSLEVSGAFSISLTEFNIERPSLLLIPVQDELRFTVSAAFMWKADRQSGSQ